MKWDIIKFKLLIILLSVVNNSFAQQNKDISIEKELIDYMDLCEKRLDQLSKYMVYIMYVSNEDSCRHASVSFVLNMIQVSTLSFDRKLEVGGATILVYFDSSDKSLEPFGLKAEPLSILDYRKSIAKLRKSSDGYILGNRISIEFVVCKNSIRKIVYEDMGLNPKRYFLGF